MKRFFLVALCLAVLVIALTSCLNVGVAVDNGAVSQTDTVIIGQDVQCGFVVLGAGIIFLLLIAFMSAAGNAA